MLPSANMRNLCVHARPGSLKWSIENFLLDARARDLSDETISFYKTKLRPFTIYLLAQGITRASKITLRDIHGYIVALREDGKGPANVHAYARALRAFIHWLVENELLDPSITRSFKMPRAPQPIREGFTRDQLDDLLRAARTTPQAERDTAILLLMADTGIRSGEVSRIRDDECELDRLRVHGKGRKERFVPLAPTTRKAIQRWRKVRGPSELLFITRRGDPMNRQAIYQLYRRLGRSAGITPCYPHMMRRTTAVEWIRAGGDTFSLQALLGHSSQAMSRIYVSLADDDVATAHRRLSLVEHMKKRR